MSTDASQELCSLAEPPRPGSGGLQLWGYGSRGQPHASLGVHPSPQVSSPAGRPGERGGKAPPASSANSQEQGALGSRVKPQLPCQRAQGTPVCLLGAWASLWGQVGVRRTRVCSECSLRSNLAVGEIHSETWREGLRSHSWAVTTRT